VLIDSGASRASWIPVSHNVLGFPQGVNGIQLLDILRAHADEYGAQRIKDEVTKLTIDGGRFSATSQQVVVSAATVLLATGGLDIEPEIKNPKAKVQAGLIRHCPVCDAYEARGKRIALVSYGKCRVKEALLIRGYTSDLTVITLGHPADINEEEMKLLKAAGVKVLLHPIEKLTQEGAQIAAWRTDSHKPLLFDTIYSALGMHLRSELAVSLGAKLDPHGALLVDRHQQTTVPGLYAAGDVVHGLSQVSVAAGQAAIASTAINASLPPIRY
jgi:thioredoxin reductase (NADPH)